METLMLVDQFWSVFFVKGHVHSVTLGSYFCHTIKLPNTRFTDVTLVYCICQSTKKGKEKWEYSCEFFSTF